MRFPVEPGHAHPVRIKKQREIHATIIKTLNPCSRTNFVISFKNFGKNMV